MSRPGRGSDGAQLALLDGAGRVHRDARVTEHLAAESVRGKVNTLRVAVLDLLRSCPEGLTDDEGGARLRARFPRADRLTFGRRRQELTTSGLVWDSGARRQTPAGRWAIVWRSS